MDAGPVQAKVEGEGIYRAGSDMQETEGRANGASLLEISRADFG